MHGYLTKIKIVDDYVKGKTNEKYCVNVLVRFRLID